MDRITEKMLQQMVKVLNNQAGTPQEPYTKGSDGKYTPNANCYHLDHAYGGVGLCQMCETGTGVRSIIGGHMPKRELYDRLRAFIDGIAVGKEA